MLEYLDNRFNFANSLNENYSRELLELHTLGVDGGYTQGGHHRGRAHPLGLGHRLRQPGWLPVPREPP